MWHLRLWPCIALVTIGSDVDPFDINSFLGGAARSGADRIADCYSMPDRDGVVEGRAGSGDNPKPWVPASFGDLTSSDPP